MGEISMLPGSLRDFRGVELRNRGDDPIAKSRGVPPSRVGRLRPTFRGVPPACLRRENGLRPKFRGVPPACLRHAAAFIIGAMESPYWQVLRRVTVYDSAWVRVHRDDIRLPDGSMIEGHHVVDVPRAAVGIVPVREDGQVLLIEHYRFITGTIGWEIPAGGINADETVECAAARELMEETGHAAPRLRQLGRYFPSNGLSNQTFHVCVGEGVVHRGEIADTNEVCRIGWFSLGEIKEMVRSNAIRDGLSLTGLLWFLFDR